MIPPNLAGAYQAALSAAPAPAAAPAAPPPSMPSPQPPLQPRIPQNVSPMTQQGETFFLDPAMFEDDECNVGDEVMLKCTIQSKGSKIGMTPVEVVMEGEGPDDNEEEGTQPVDGAPTPAAGQS